MIEGALDCNHGRFDTLQLYTATVKQTFAWHDVQSVRELDLRNAAVGVIWDDKPSWPKKWNLHLDGFVYGGIAAGPRDAETRLEWLDREGEFKPQPYLQLAKVLRDLGDDGGAKEVLFELENRSRAEDRRRLIHAPMRWLRSSEDKISDVAVGYGIYPRNAFRYLSLLTLLGWLLYRRAQRIGAMAPTDKDAYKEFRDHDGVPPPYYPRFSPLIYSLENCLPLVKFGQDDRWQPDPVPPPRKTVSTKPTGIWGWIVAIRDRLLDFLVPNLATSPGALRWVRWIIIALGWLLATFFVAGITGIIKTG